VPRRRRQGWQPNGAADAGGLSAL